AGSAAHDRSISSTGVTGAADQRLGDTRRAVAGTVTKLPAPVRLTRKPLLRSASYAVVMVARLSARCFASSRSDGRRVAGAMRPSKTSAVMPSARALYTGPGA